MQALDDFLSRHLSRVVDHAVHHAGAVIAGCAVLTVSFGAYAALHLGVNSDNVKLVSEDLPSRQNHEAFAKLFPNLENALLIVIDGESPEAARDGAEKMVRALRARTDTFAGAYVPGGGDFFETHGLLYRSPDDLDAFGDQMARIQPILAELEREPSIANLASLVEQGLALAASGEDAPLRPEDWASILDSVGTATVAVYSEFPLALSWEETLLAGSAVEVVRRRVVVADPILDFSSIFAARAAMQEIRDIARAEGLSEDRGVRVRITGNPALNFEEMAGIAWDIGMGGVLCFLVVIAILTRALRSFRLVMAAVITLLMGLVWSAAFAAFAVGHLSLVSAAFGILFIGLGVDFAIHLGMAYASRLREGSPHEHALREAMDDVGSSLLICTVTTAIGFLVFVPTDYLGVAELGLIAGGSMFIVLGLTLTLFPALLSTGLRVDRRGALLRPLHFRSTWWRFFDHHPRAIALLAVVLYGAALPVMRDARFDANVIAMRNPETESVQAFNDLLASSGALSPWFINSVAPDLDAADRLAARMERLETVSHTLTLSDYVPPDQDEKLYILEDIAFLLDTPPPPSTAATPTPDRATVDEQIAALRELADFLEQDFVEREASTLGRSMRFLRDRLEEFLTRIDSDEDPGEALRTLEDILLSGLPDQLRRVREAVGTGEITMESLPAELEARMMTSEGVARIQVFPAVDLSDEENFIRFVDEVQSVDPNAAGVAVNLVEFGRATRSSFRQALISAGLIIGTMLLLLWRSVRSMLLVIFPLSLGAVLTVATATLLDIPFNFADVVVIPLLLGIGVASGVPLVHRAHGATPRAGRGRPALGRGWTGPPGAPRLPGRRRIRRRRARRRKRRRHPRHWRVRGPRYIPRGRRSRCRRPSPARTPSRSRGTTDAPTSPPPPATPSVPSHCQCSLRSSSRSQRSCLAEKCPAL